MFWEKFPSIAPDVVRVRDLIREELGSPSGELSSALVDLASRDAKLLRPGCMVLSARFGVGEGEIPERVVRLAAALEMLHMATLVHDDIVDDAATRRGGAALHRAYGVKEAVLMGDLLFAKALELVAEYASREHAVFLSRGVRHILDGEIEEVEVRRALGSEAFSMRRYLRRILRKTGLLFVVAFHLGASEAGAEVEVVRRLRRIGYNVGMAFQVIDDVLDVAGRELGKPVGRDVEQGVVGAPAVMLARKEGERLGGWMRRACAGGVAGRVWAGKVRRLLVDSGAVEEARGMAQGFTDRAMREAAGLPEGRWRTVLEGVLAELVVRRV